MGGGRRTDNIKPLIRKRYRNLTKGIETALCQAQPRENKGTTNAAVVIGIDRKDKEEDQSEATGEEKFGKISEDEGSHIGEEEEVE